MYLIASAALMAALAPQLAATVRAARQGSDYRAADGICSLLDSLHPGIRATLSFGAWMTTGEARLFGNEVVIADGNTTVGLASRWILPNVTLSPGVSYQVWLVGDEVMVSKAG